MENATEKVPVTNDDLMHYIGQLVFVTHSSMPDILGQLRIQDGNFFVQQVGFPLDRIAELRKIEVAPEINAVRAVIVISEV